MEPGVSESCRGDAGKVAPVVDRNRCEGKQDCVCVCPYDVFEMGSLSKADRTTLSLVGRIRALAHGNRQAFVIRPEAGQVCRLCIEACPENALTLAPHSAQS